MDLLIEIEGFKKTFKVYERDAASSSSLHSHLLKLHRCYVISYKMQYAVHRGLYKATKIEKI